MAEQTAVKCSATCSGVPAATNEVSFTQVSLSYFSAMYGSARSSR